MPDPDTICGGLDPGAVYSKRTEVAPLDGLFLICGNGEVSALFTYARRPPPPSPTPTLAELLDEPSPWFWPGQPRRNGARPLG